MLGTQKDVYVATYLFMAADDNYKETSNTYSLTVKKILYSWSASCNCYNEDDTLCKSTTINKYGYSSRNDASSACTNNKTQECRNKCLSCDMGRIVPGQCSTDSYTQ